MSYFFKKLPRLFLTATLAISTSITTVKADDITVQELKPTPKLGTIAKLTATIISNQHYKQHPIDDEISKQLFDEYFKTLDPNKIFFTKADIDKFKSYRLKLDDQLINSDVSFAFEVYNLLIKRLADYKDFVREQVKKGFNFDIDETYQVDRTKSERAKDKVELEELWRKKIKNEIIGYKLLEKDKDKKKDKKSVFFVKRTPSENVLHRAEQHIKRLSKNDGMDILELYLISLTKIYDPHSTYMAPRTQKDFNINMKLSFGGIGAVLRTDDGYTTIVRLIKGGPADLAGELHPDDRIIAVAQDNKEPVNIIDMPLSKVVELIRGEKFTKVHLTILEASKGVGALPKVITIVRDTVKLKDSEASGEIRTIKNGAGQDIKVGVITLPSFYMDFEAAIKNEDYKSSTKDVKKIIENFKKEGVKGIIFDIRSNGGGSLMEAISLSGLFIKDGPIVQVKSSDGSVQVSEDPDNSIVYSGPLIVLMNKLSASASEIFAGAMKDYNRAILVGDKSTHGKGTVQTIFSLDRLAPYWRLSPPTGSIKFTNAKFYRINGASTQRKGVIPNIIFPSFTDSMDIGEASLEHALPWDTISPVDHTDYGKDLSKIIKTLKDKSITRQKSSKEFQNLKKEISTYESLKNKKDVSLNINVREKMYKKEKELTETQTEVMKLDQMSLDKKKDEKKSKDIYLDESLHILSDYIDISGSK